ncbi:hypothetical protein D3C76_212520 [compost metagenome]
MEQHFTKQLEGFNGDYIMLLYLIEQDGGLFTERIAYDIGTSLKLDGRKFVRMHSESLPVFKPA